MFKALVKCSLCGQVGDRDEMIVYNFITGPRLVCKKCYRQLPPEPIKLPHQINKKRNNPNDDLFPPIN